MGHENTWEEISRRLKTPFPASEIKWKAAATNRENTMAMAVAFIDARNVMDRLDDVVGPGEWGDDYEVIGAGAGEFTVQCALTVLDVTRRDVGDSSAARGSGENAAKSAYSDALKRAAVKFGIARYLYALPRQWVTYDGKRLTETPSLPAWALPSGDTSKPSMEQDPINIEDQQERFATEQQREQIRELMHNVFHHETDEHINYSLKERGYSPLESLTPSQADKIIAGLSNHQNGEQPLTPPQIKKLMSQSKDDRKASQAQAKLVARKLGEVLADAGIEDVEAARHAIQQWLTGVESASDMTRAHVRGILDLWLQMDKDTYAVKSVAKVEIKAILERAKKETDNG